MKGKVLLFGFLLAFISSFSQNTNSWVRGLSGTIDKYPVTMLLHKAGHNYFGYYYYNNQLKPIYFTGEDTSNKGKVRLMAFADNESSEEFTFSLSGEVYSGKWIKNEKSQPLIFSAKEVSLPVPFTYVYTEGSRKLRANMKESPVASYNSGTVWPLGETPIVPVIKKKIRNEFVQNPYNTDIGELLLKQKKSYLDTYVTDYKDAKLSEIKEAPFAYSQDESDQVLVCFISEKLISLASYSYSYTGGAHGNYGTRYMAFDLLRAKELTLNDVLTAEGKKQLNRLLEKNARLQFNLKANAPLTEAGFFENHLKANDNFYITSKGIGFSYNPYEVGPYAMGEINIYIPFTQLTNYITPALKSLL